MNYKHLVPKLNKIIRVIPRDYEAFQSAKRSPHDFFDSVIADPTADNLYLGFVAANLLRKGQGRLPTSLSGIINRVNRHYSDLGQHNVSYVRSQLKSEFPKDYREEKGSLLVVETERRTARVEVCGKGKVQFRVGLPFRFFENKPKEGNKYRMTIWDFYQHWFGVHNVAYQGSAIPEWTEEKRTKFISSLEKIKFGLRIERNGER